MNRDVALPKEGSLRVWNVINVPGKAHYYPVATPREGYDLIDRLARRQLQDRRISSNIFGLEVFEGGEWSEWYDEEGRDVDEAFEDVEGQLEREAEQQSEINARRNA